MALGTHTGPMGSRRPPANPQVWEFRALALLVLVAAQGPPKIGSRAGASVLLLVRLSSRLWRARSNVLGSKLENGQPEATEAPGSASRCPRLSLQWLSTLSHGVESFDQRATN